MDLRVYYQKIREAEAALQGDAVVVVSLETPDGGKPNVQTEVSRQVAARLIVDGRARVATGEESRQFREETAEARRAAEQAALSSRVQVTVLSENDLRTLKGASRPGKA
ncbi:MAG: hypothetical protein WD696_16535 [Bryobacteraceae bacterium]